MDLKKITSPLMEKMPNFLQKQRDVDRWNLPNNPPKSSTVQEKTASLKGPFYDRYGPLSPLECLIFFNKPSFERTRVVL